MSARVVQEQDRAASPAQMAVRIRPPRSTPIDVKALIVKPVMPGVISRLIIDHHYLHAMPSPCWRCFGVYAGDTLMGGAVFTAGPRHGYRVLSGARPQQVAILARLWLADDLPKNAESRTLAMLIHLLRREGAWKLLLSYADPGAGHEGVIYRASGWLYLGKGEPSRYLDLGDGRPVHPCTAYGRLGTNNLGHLHRTGIDARQMIQAGKHRYAYVLDPAWRWRLRDAALPYPGKVAAP